MQEADKMLEEAILLVTEYDPQISDWRFRSGVILDVLRQAQIAVMRERERMRNEHGAQR